MAKANKGNKPKNTKKPVAPKIEKPEYGVDQLAAELGVNAASARVHLRAGGESYKKSYKPGRAWDFKNASTLKQVAKEIQAKSKKNKAAKKE